MRGAQRTTSAKTINTTCNKQYATHEFRMGSSHSRHKAPILPPVPPQTFTSKRHLIVLHSIAIALHLTSGSLGAYLVSTTKAVNVDIIVPYFAYVTGKLGVFIEPVPETIFTVSILWPPVAVEFITAFFHVIYIMLLALPSWDAFVRRYVANTSSLNPLRWTEYAITATLMSSFGAIAVGITDFYLFLKMLSSGIALQSVGYILEVLSATEERTALKNVYTEYKDVDPAIGKKLKRVAHALRRREQRIFRLLWWVVGFFLNITNVLILLWQTFASRLGDALWLYIANSVPFAVWFNTFGYISQRTFEKWRQFEDPYFAEKYYIILSLSTKVAVFWLSFGTFREIIESNGAVAASGVSWEAVRYLAMFLPAAWVVVYATVDSIQWTKFVHRAHRTHASERMLRYSDEEDSDSYRREDGDAYNQRHLVFSTSEDEVDMVGGKMKRRKQPSVWG
jgi:hypothetical protein